ncbi:protein WALLS ARE THIN 1-like [Syzygium oleosum]|uniref:protein WALLS ARE THIN 1-like n=1 Tax=Syzygium oleosum TaxID=219896 RepID=UPI0024BAE210|nr:protein WALLS ARE THIN 1-like [Syzygium oleosum]
MENGASYVAMVLVQLAYGGSNILMKIALENGLDRLVFIVYCHLIAVLLLGPLAFVLESRKQRPSLSVKVMAKIFVLSSLGTTIHLNVYYAGLAYTSATVASALSNVIPCISFLFAVMLRMEKLSIKNASGRAKIFGALICVGGSLTFTFWKKGYLIRSLLTKPLISLHDTSQASDVLRHGKENWIKGSLLILTSHTAWSAWLILQAVVYKAYPAPLSLTTLICVFASLQSSVLSLFFARDRSLWKLEWNVQLWTIIYAVCSSSEYNFTSPHIIHSKFNLSCASLIYLFLSTTFAILFKFCSFNFHHPIKSIHLAHFLPQGVVSSSLVYYLQTWCISHKGPVFVAMFSPLQLVIVGIFSAVAFEEQFHLGSLIGACIIVLGLYCVLWGKRKESLDNAQLENQKAVADCNAQEISMTTVK